MTEGVRELEIVGHPDHAIQPNAVASAGPRQPFVPAHPDRRAERDRPIGPDDRANLGDRGPPEGGLVRIRRERSLEGHALGGEPPQERRSKPLMVDAAPPGTEGEHAHDGDGHGREGLPPTRSGVSQRLDDWRPGGKARSDERSRPSAGAPGSEPTSGEGRDPEREGHRGFDPGRDPIPREETEREGDRRHGQRPRAHGCPSDRDLVADLLEGRRPDPAHVQEIVDSRERSVLRAVLDDRGGEHLADA
jgi:hypothetical protein